jgi:hypothetical protein
MGLKFPETALLGSRGIRSRRAWAWICRALVCLLGGRPVGPGAILSISDPHARTHRNAVGVVDLELHGVVTPAEGMVELLRHRAPCRMATVH